MKLTLLIFGAAAAVVCAAEAPLKAVYPEAKPVCGCEELAKVSLPNTTIESAKVDSSDGSCRVTAVVTHPPASDRVKVFVGLPVTNWNGRFRGTGGGGFVGGNPGGLRGPVGQGYVAAATDTGHEGGSGSFALDASGRLNWQLIIDNAYLGIHEMTVVGKALTEKLYGKAPKYSYFVGSSTGGRQGITEAQRYPEDYDGIFSGCPAINWHRFVPSDLWPQVVMAELNNYVSKAKLDAATAAAVAACDLADGVKDGVIDDPKRCGYDPKALVGTKVDGSEFTEKDAEVVRRIWEGARGVDGKFLWHGLTRGTDLSALSGTEGSPLRGKPFSIALDYFRFYLAQDPKFSGTDLNTASFEALWKQSVEEFGGIFGADDLVLNGFRDRGGKIIITHGLADQLITSNGSIDFYRGLQKRMGGEKATAKFARLFLSPGTDHGFRGRGPAPTGVIEALIKWVEEGKAPDELVGERRDASGKVIGKRPLYAFPYAAKYKGAGDPEDAKNYRRVRYY